MSISPPRVEYNIHSRVNALRAQLKELQTENEFLDKSILKLNKTLKSLEDSLTNSRPNFQVLKSKIENESKHTKLHLAISENLKKAMKELRTNENIKCAKISRENITICNYSSQSDALKFIESDLLASLERLKLNLRTSVSYKSLRPTLCSTCSLTINNSCSAEQIYPRWKLLPTSYGGMWQLFQCRL